MVFVVFLSVVSCGFWLCVYASAWVVEGKRGGSKGVWCIAGRGGEGVGVRTRYPYVKRLKNKKSSCVEGRGRLVLARSCTVSALDWWGWTEEEAYLSATQPTAVVVRISFVNVSRLRLARRAGVRAREGASGPPSGRARNRRAMRWHQCGIAASGYWGADQDTIGRHPPLTPAMSPPIAEYS